MPDEMTGEATTAESSILFHVILSDRDEWAIEAEWPNGTLERVAVFTNHSAATDWIARRSQAWLQFQRIDKIVTDLKQSAKRPAQA
jgi:hypothetical protein